MINKFDLIDLYRKSTLNDRVHILPVPCSKSDHILDHKASLNKFQSSEIR